VYPAYVDAHRRLFEGGDVENGLPVSSITSVGSQRLKVLDGMKTDMDGLLEESCLALEASVVDLPP
jgi:hypothetical protein